MLLESVEYGPLIWTMIEENGVTKTKKYAELSATEKIQADCDLKETNIILQGLPSDIYSLVNHHRVAKDLWERIQLLMQGTSLTKQKRKCKLYDAFDKFAHIKGESLHQYYLRFTQLINDINIYKIKLEQFQVNTKFVNSLPPEWSKFKTDVKLVKYLHTTNFDRLHAYLQQHELHANKFRLMRERNQDPLALSPQYGSIHPIQHYSTTYPSTPLAITYAIALYPNAYSFIVHQEAYPQQQSVPQIEYTISAVNQQTHLAKFSQIDSGLAVPVFKQGDDPIDAINKMMSFLSTVATSCFPSTNNQLRNSSNPRQQSTIHDGRCLKPKRKRDATWFRDKVLLVEAQGNGKVLNEEELEFLADPCIAECPVTQMETDETNERYIAPCFVNGLEAYDGEVNLKFDENLISNEFVVKLCLDYEVKKGKTLVKKELIVALNGELYFVKFIINPEEDDFEPRFREELPPFVCKMGKSNRNKKRAMENLNLFYQDIRPSSSAGGYLTQEEAAKEALATRIS
ncbi:hypothetical protein Tco_1419608 [Tanacetum coccineum]